MNRQIKRKYGLARNKLGVSEIVSYVLLILITMSIAAGIYSWIKFQIPSSNEQQECSENTAISVNAYSCDTAKKLLNLTVENRGYYNIDGFFLRVGNDTEKIPVNSINSTSGLIVQPGRYDFLPINFKPSEMETIVFDYANMDSIKRMQLQPFVNGENNALLICKNIIDIQIENCN